MSLFIETIRADHGIIAPLLYHQQRVNETLSYFRSSHAISLEHVLKAIAIPNYPITKIRVIYGIEGIQTIECMEYKLRSINSLAIVHADEAEYRFKSTDRQWLRDLTNEVDADEIILVKKGMITDASYANLAFYKNDIWYTPSQPLLKGTRRAALIEQGLLFETPISINDISLYSHIKLINAMMSWEESPMLHIDQVKS